MLAGWASHGGEKRTPPKNKPFKNFLLEDGDEKKDTDKQARRKPGKKQ